MGGRREVERLERKKVGGGGGGVSNLVFYAQSTITVISGERHFVIT